MKKIFEVANGNYDTKVVVEDIPDMTFDEAEKYVEYSQLRLGRDKVLTNLNVTLDDEGRVHLDYVSKNPSFERIRRITGYLVGSIDRWNDAKRAEEHDRVKHAL